MLRFSADSIECVPEGLLASSMLDGAPVEMREPFLKSLRFCSAEADTVLYGEGEPGDTLWIVVQGEVTLTRQTASGEQVELDRAGANDLFGELAVISPATRAATARTSQPTDLLTLTRAQFQRLIDAREPCSEALLRYATLRICRRLRQLDERIDLAHEVRE